MNEHELLQAISHYKFYHIIQLNDNIATPGNPNFVPAQNLFIKHIKTIDLKGKRVLDIGCRDGLFSFLAESMGAEEIIGIDNDISKPATEFLIPYFKSKVKMVQMNLYDLQPDSFGTFDVVFFPGVLYHLRYPFWGLRAIRDVLRIGGDLLIDTPIWEGDPNNALLYCPIGNESPYEPSSCAFFNEKGLVDTLTSMGFETVAMEYLKRKSIEERKGIGKLINVMKRLRKRNIAGMKTCLSMVYAIPNSAVHRCVFHSKFQGYDKESFLTKYWEGVHDFHNGN